LKIHRTAVLVEHESQSIIDAVGTANALT
jgi:hypothetical protein